MENFKPLDTYGNWVYHARERMNGPMQDEVRRVLQQQIDEMIPAGTKYRRRILFTTTEDINALSRTITWRYTPDLLIMTEEIAKISQALHKILDQPEYRIKGYPQTSGTGRGFIHHYVEKRVGDRWVHATEWMFISAVRAQVWIDKQLVREVSF